MEGVSEPTLCSEAIDSPTMITPRFKIIAQLVEFLYPAYKIVKRSCRTNSLKIHVLHDDKIVFVIGRP